MRARYYSEKRIREEAGNVEIIESAYPTERLMKNKIIMFILVYITLKKLQNNKRKLFQRQNLEKEWKINLMKK